MINEKNFVIRVSGRRENSYYIDYSGAYKIEDISKLTGIKLSSIKDIYQKNGAVYDNSIDVYYFSSRESAQKTVDSMLGEVKHERKGRAVILTDAEIEYIRKALINEGINTIHVSNKIKDDLFKKLNN